MALYSDRQSNFNIRFFACYLLTAIILVGAPLVGMVLTSHDLERFTRFPPRPGYVIHAKDNWPLFFLGLTLFVSLIALWVKRALRAPKILDVRGAKGAFPLWGWLGLSLLLAAWGVSWNLLPVGQWLRNWSFTPLWLGFILVLNALSKWRMGTCLLTSRPLSFWLLFPLSSVFWWYFEFLNRFVENWYYVGVETFGSLQYALMASLAFSTVLPGVLSMNELLKSVKFFEDAFIFEGLKGRRPRKDLALAVLLISVAGLGLMGLFPDYLFPLLWVSPLLVICSLKVWFNVPNLLELVLASGNLGPVARLAASALACGLFWEMWNFWSYPKWVYSIPFVGQFKLFEMPILGYLGYLPFGLECAAVASILIPIEEIIGLGALGNRQSQAQ